MTKRWILSGVVVVALLGATAGLAFAAGSSRGHLRSSGHQRDVGGRRRDARLTGHARFERPHAAALRAKATRCTNRWTA